MFGFGSLAHSHKHAPRHAYVANNAEAAKYKPLALVVAAVLVIVTAAALLTGSPRPAAAATWDPPIKTVAAAELRIYLKPGEQLWLDNPNNPFSRLTDSDGNFIDGNGNPTERPVQITATTPTHVATASKEGVWTVKSFGIKWNAEVRDSNGDPIPGRIWTEVLDVRQPPPNDGMDLTYYVVNDTGYIYQLDLLNFQGIASLLYATSTGVPRSEGDCRPTYKNGGKTIPSPECGHIYRFFFEKPAADLPTSANLAGKRINVLPPPLALAALRATDASYRPDEAESTNPAGTFNFELDSRFIGTAILQIDVDGDGSYNGPRDVNIDQYTPGGSIVYHWDGKDAAGVPVIVGNKKLNVRLNFDRLGEVHLTMNDVEGRDGIRFVRLNGPGAPDPTIYFNDRYSEGDFEEDWVRSIRLTVATVCTVGRSTTATPAGTAMTGTLTTGRI